MQIKLPLRSFFINKVIDGRSGDTSRIGIVQKGLANRKVEALMEKGVVSSFSTLINLNYLDIQFEEKQEPLVLEIKELEISEWTTFSKETGRLEMTVAFYRNRNNVFEPVFAAELIEENSSGLDVTASHSNRIKRGLEKSLIKLQEFLTESNHPSFYSDVEGEFQNNIKKFDLKVQTYDNSIKEKISLNSPHRFGIYLSLEEFKKNQPKIVGNFKPEYSDDKSTAKLYAISTNKVLKGRFFGFSDGGKVYIYSQNYSPSRRFVSVSEMGTIMAWKDNVYDSRDMTNQALFGVVGMAIANSGRDGDCITLDTRTGIFKVMQPRDMEILLSSDKDLFDRYISNEKRKNSNTMIDFIRDYNKKNPLD
ncbi:MAG: hypothetical protein MUF58_14565 [Arcicella sp.]|jgi:hypothetical protein|nr:hypothetical protein [Arcicella sp.]